MAFDTTTQTLSSHLKEMYSLREALILDERLRLAKWEREFNNILKSQWWQNDEKKPEYNEYGEICP